MVYVCLEQLMVLLRDGRTLIAFLRSLDQFGMCKKKNETEFISFSNTKDNLIS